jgi:transmembrane sensor
MAQRDLKQLFWLYQRNRISEKELQEFFALLEQAEHDEEMKKLLDEAWDEIPSQRPFRRSVIRRPLFLYGAAAAVLLILTFVAWPFIRQRNSIPQFAQSNAPGQPPRAVTLPDGSIAWLNAASSLQYHNREVTVTGEVYFEVASKAGKPFIVHSQELNIEVLGTSFNVAAYPNESASSVTVLTGKVAVQANGQRMELIANQQAVYAKATHTLQEQPSTNAADLAAWAKGSLIFHNMPVREAINRLQRRFNISITVDQNLNHCLFYGDFTGESPADILKMFAASVNGQVTRENGNYHISGTGCF